MHFTGLSIQDSTHAGFSTYLVRAVSLSTWLEDSVVQPFDVAHGLCHSAISFGERKILLNPPFQKEEGRKRGIRMLVGEQGSCLPRT